MPEYLDCIAASAPSRVCLVISEKWSVFSTPGRPLRELLYDMRVLYGPDFKYKIVVYERKVLK